MPLTVYLPIPQASAKPSGYEPPDGMADAIQALDEVVDTAADPIGGGISTEFLNQGFSNK